MAKFLVIEPHADDAFLSLHAHMKRWVDTGSEVFIHTEFYETARRQHEANDYAASIGAEWLMPNEAVRLRRTEALTVVCPVGIEHPEHVATFDRWGGLAQLYYLDMPYAVKLKNEVIVNRDIRGTKIHSFMRPHANKWKSARFFKSQAKFFHFNLDNLKAASFEMLVTK